MTSAREGRWASSHIGRQRVRDGAVVLPNLSTQVVLGVRREEAAPRGAQTARELRSEDALPAPLADAQTARARRAQSADERGPSPRRRATERRGAGHGGERFLELLASPGAGVLDARALARLEAEAGPGRQQEVVRLLRTLRDLVNVRDGLQKGGAAEGGAAPRAPEGQDEHQLAAQVAYLEKKVVQLRGKLKGRARDHHPPDHQDGAPGPEQDPRAASREELEAQVQALRERKAQLEAEALLGAPPPGAAGPAGGAATEDAAGAQEAETDALRRRAEKLEAQVAELAAAKEAAARSAEAARALVEAAEARLQEMIVTRETERIRLEAERDALRRRIDENQRWLEEEEALGDVEDASAVQKMVESVEERLAQAKRRNDQASLPEQHSHSRAPAVERRCGRRARPATSMQGLRRLRDDKEATLQELRQAEEELEQARSESRARLQQLEGRVAEAARECELEAERRRQQLVAEASARCGTLGEQAGAAERRAQTVRLARAELEVFVATLEAERKAELARADESVDRRRQSRKGAAIERPSGISGRFYLALRPQVYDRWEVMHYLCAALCLEADMFQVLEESVVPADTRMDQLVETRGEPLPPCRERMSSFVRALPESRRDPRPPSVDEPPPQDADEAAGACARQGPPPEYSLVRLVVELTLPGDEGEQEVVDRFVGMVRDGGSLLEDVAVVGVCALRGRPTFRGLPGSAAWPASQARLAFTKACDVSGRHCVVTGYCTDSPLALKLLAVEHGSEEVFVLCLGELELRRLLGAPQGCPVELQGAAGLELLGRLSIVECLGGRPVLVATFPVDAPATVLNAAPSPAPTPAGAPALEAAGQAAPAPPGGELQGAIAPVALEMQGSAPPAAVRPAQAPCARRGRAPRDTGRLSFEDVLEFEERFFVLSVSEEESTGALHVRLQESGTCAALDALLPGRRHERQERPARQLRIFAQSHDFRDLVLFLAIEDIAVPHGLMVRVARGGAAGWEPSTWRDPGQRVYWLGREGGPVFGAGDDGAGADVHVAVAPPEHRRWLLDFARSETSYGEAQHASASARCLLQPRYGAEGTREGIVLRAGAAGGHAARDAEVLKASAAQWRASAEQPSGRLLLRRGRRLRAPDGGSVLCVLLICEQAEPHLHFTVGAYQAGGGRSWMTMVDSLDVYRLLRVRVGAGAGAPGDGERAALAQDLAGCCALASDAPGRWRLALEAPAARPERTAARALAASGGSLAGGPPAREASAEEQAAECLSGDGRHCLLRAARPLRGQPFHVWIFDEPSAPNAIFALNSFLVVARGVPEGKLLALRLQDADLAKVLALEEHVLLDPAQRPELLRRLAEGLDLGPQSPSRGASAEQLVVQATRTCPEPLELSPDEAGVLVGPEPGGALGHTGTRLAITDGSFGRGTASQIMGMETTQMFGGGGYGEGGEQLVASIGAAALHLDSIHTPTGLEPLSARKQATLGSIRVDLVLRLDGSRRAHVLSIRPRADDAECADAVVEVQMPADGDPTRVYMEHRDLAGVPCVIAMWQQPFPHKVEAVIFDPRAHEEVSIAVQDEEIVPLVERSAREHLSDLMEQLLRAGSLGSSARSGGAELHRRVPRGSELSPLDPTARWLQRYVPVIAAELSEGAPRLPGSPSSSGAREALLFSCRRYVVGPSLVPPSASELEALPLVTLSLLEGRGPALEARREVTLRIERTVDGVDERHDVRLRGKLVPRPLSLYAEIQKVGGLRLLVLALDDHSPRALRVAVLEPASGWSFQAVVADAAALPEGPPTASPSPARGEVLQFFRRRLSIRGGLPAPPPAPSQLASAASTAPPAIMPEAICLKRETRFTADDGVVLLSATFEAAEAGGEGGGVCLRCMLSQPSSAKESRAELTGPALERLLAVCGLPPPRSLAAEHLGPEAVRARVGELLLGAVEVLPSLELHFEPERLPTAGADGEGPPPAAPPRPSTREWRRERLLGRIERGPEPIGAGAPPEPALRVEVFDGSDCVEALFHTTNLRLRVTDLRTSSSAKRDINEDDLEPWLRGAGAEHLLCGSREADLVALLLRRASLAPAGAAGARAVALDPLDDGALATGDLGADFLEALQANLDAGGSPGVCHAFGDDEAAAGLGAGSPAAARGGSWPAAGGLDPAAAAEAPEAAAEIRSGGAEAAEAPAEAEPAGGTPATGPEAPANSAGAAGAGGGGEAGAATAAAEG